MIGLKKGFHIFNMRLQRQVLRLHVESLFDNDKNIIQWHGLLGSQIFKEILHFVLLLLRELAA